jgi:hypothetical protein
MFFTFPEDAHWNAERQAVEFGVEIGEYHGVVRVPRRVFQRLLPERPTPERCVEAYYLQRTRFEGIAERKLRRQQLTEDGNVEISGRDLREAPDADRSCRRPANGGIAGNHWRPRRRLSWLGQRVLRGRPAKPRPRAGQDHL